MILKVFSDLADSMIAPGSMQRCGMVRNPDILAVFFGPLIICFALMWCRDSVLREICLKSKERFCYELDWSGNVG